MAITQKAPNRRFYLVTDKGDASNKALVEAGSPASAVGRVARAMFDVHVATQIEVMEMVRGEGMIIEYAKGEDMELPLDEPHKGDTLPPKDDIL